ncbi:MAG: chemotaxis protein CheB, partial [Persicimonas sp.]
MSQDNAKLDGDVAPKDNEQKEGRDARDRLAVVGIGASAGGVAALQTFFKNVPADTQVAYVVVMHLSPEHESHLQDVLQNVSPVPVTQVSKRTPMEPGRVYVIPPDKNIQITDGHLIVTEFEEPRGQRAPIDVFFRTLARTHPDGIGVILSGSGTDGTMGMKAIKEEGGVLIVQLPDEAEYDAMPKSAIATGLIDFVLPADQIAAKVEELAANADVGPLTSEDEIGADEEATLRKILVQLQARTGHDFSGYKRNTLFRRIARRMRVCQVDSLEDYLEYLRRNQSEAAALQKDFLISVTDFFRDPDAFAALAETAIEDLVEHCPKDREMRIWVPGCATGEEAYSLAILLLEAADRFENAPSFQLFATDLDEGALAYAREGSYPHAIATDVSEERLRRFFISEGPNFRIKRELREMVLFATHDLLKDPPFSQISLISCRNLLIYLQRDLQSKVFELFHYALESDGYLFLGGSESAESAQDLFRSVDKRHRIYQAKPKPAHMHHRLPALPLSTTPRVSRQIHKRTPNIEIPRPATDFETHEQSLEAHAPPSLLVDENFDVIHLSKHAGRYLQMPGGTPTSNAVKLVSSALRLDLRSGLQEVFENHTPMLSPAITIDLDGERRAVRIYVSPVQAQEDDSELALVLFVETDPAKAGGRVIDEADYEDARAEHMAREVARLRERLQLTSEKAETQQEELKATNEELQSINEEYKSTLEELETSKEELQSVNEELKTVNAELKEKVEALSRANDDLQNLMGATDIATLFVDRQLQIQLYTPALEQLFNIRALDEGRPLSHVTHRLDVDDLEALASEVLRTLVPHEETLEHADGRTYLMRILPYRTTEDRIEGVILTFVDITVVKETREALRRTREHYKLLIESVDEYAIFTTDENGCVVSWNPGAVRLFGYQPDEILGEPSALVFT